MNVLVTGGAGYVGGICTEQLISAGHKVVVVDNLSTGHRAAVHSRAHFWEADFGDTRLIKDLVREHSIDAVMHFAGETLVEKSMTDPRVYFHSNVRKGLDFVDLLLECEVRKFIFSSSAAVYGEPISTPITESHPTQPINAYGESKLMFERILGWYRHAYGLQYAALRYFNAAGASQLNGEDHSPESHLLPRLLNALINETGFVIHGDDYPTPDGTCIRDYVHVLDIAEAHILVMETLEDDAAQGAFNIGSSTGYSVRQIMETVKAVTGRSVRFSVGPRRQGDPATLTASHDRLAQALGWKPRYSNLRDIVHSAWDWKQRYPQGYAGADANQQTAELQR